MPTRAGPSSRRTSATGCVSSHHATCAHRYQAAREYRCQDRAYLELIAGDPIGIRHSARPDARLINQSSCHCSTATAGMSPSTPATCSRAWCTTPCCSLSFSLFAFLRLNLANFSFSYTWYVLARCAHGTLPHMPPHSSVVAPFMCECRAACQAAALASSFSKCLLMNKNLCNKI